MYLKKYSNILKEYKKNIDSGKTYKYIEEPEIEKKNNKNTKIENTAETLFGKDCIIVEQKKGNDKNEYAKLNGTSQKITRRYRKNN